MYSASLQTEMPWLLRKKALISHSPRHYLFILITMYGGFSSYLLHKRICAYVVNALVETFGYFHLIASMSVYKTGEIPICQALGYSPNLKYESDGGPGIREIIQLLLGSREAEADRWNFLKSQVVFWLLAAIDDHANNYSVFLEAGNRFRLTLLYDILSAYPLLDAGPLQRQNIRMAMSLQGKNRHYHWHRMQPRHFLTTARAVGYSAKLMTGMLEETVNQVPAVTDAMAGRLTKGGLSGEVVFEYDSCVNTDIIFPKNTDLIFRFLT